MKKKVLQIKQRRKDDRFVITLNNMIVDDANGYGFKTVESAKRSYSWKYAGKSYKKIDKIGLIGSSSAHKFNKVHYW